MNREKAKALLPIIEAFANGETIQLLYPNGKWYDIGTEDKLDFSCFVDEYRIKPKPRTFYGIIYRNGSITLFSSETRRDEIWEIVGDIFRSKNGEAKITLVEAL